MGVLLVISIPIFISQLAKARLATNQANARASKAAAIAAYMEDDTVAGGNYDVDAGTFTKGPATSGTVSVTAAPSTWTVTGNPGLARNVYKENIGATLSDGSVTKYDFK